MFWHLLLILLSPPPAGIARSSVTTGPSAATAGQAGRDGKFTAHADGLLRTQGTKPVRLPALSPNLHAHAERWIRTVREECLDRIIMLNKSHLRWVLTEFIRYYNERRPHRSLGLKVPEGPVEYPREGEVARRQVLGGLINDYYRKTA